MLSCTHLKHYFKLTSYKCFFSVSKAIKTDQWIFQILFIHVFCGEKKLTTGNFRYLLYTYFCGEKTDQWKFQILFVHVFCGEKTLTSGNFRYFLYTYFCGEKNDQWKFQILFIHVFLWRKKLTSGNFRNPKPSPVFIGNVSVHV